MKTDYRKEWVEEYDREQVTVNVLLTEQCNFKCAHCFYGCSPKTGNGYITNEMLDRIYLNIIIPLLDEEVPVSLNFIGGEPTLNLNEFGRCMDWYARRCQNNYGIEFQMTTNGWWLRKRETTKRFMNIIKPFVTGEFTEFSVRISDSVWHTEHRGLDGRQIKDRLASIWNPWEHDPDFMFDTESVCPECYEADDDLEEGEDCPNCGALVEYIECEYIPCFEPPIAPEENQPWIYVDSETNSTNVIPSGIRGQFGHNDKAAKGFCGGANCLTYAPDGRHTDGCCSGSDMPFGTVDTSPWELLHHTGEFMKSMKGYSCLECRDMAKEYAVKLKETS